MKTKLLLLCSLFLAALAQGQIIHVPADYPTIQQGIEAAGPGDTVLVADGLYYEQINFLGKKPLLVASEFLMDGDTSHIANTIIDGSQIYNPDSASVIYFNSGEDTTSVINGFTIRNGRGTKYLLEKGVDFSRNNTNLGTSLRGGFSGGKRETVVDLAGGGIFISGSGAKIINNHITENYLNDTLSEDIQVLDGAGIATQYMESDEWIVISQNVIDNNSIYATKLEGFGVGMSICYNSRIVGNTISNNTNTGTAAHVSAGGIGIYQLPDWKTITTIVEKNLVKNNLCESEGSFANSAGVFITTASGNFTGNTALQNEVSTGTSSGGACGLYLWNPAEGFQVINNMFKENTSNLFSGGLGLETDSQSTNSVWINNNYFLNNDAKYGGALVSFKVPVTFQNNVFSGNYAQGFGGAMVLSDFQNEQTSHFATIINNSFSSNQTDGWGGAIYSPHHPKILILNSVFWADSSYMYNEIATFDTIEIAYSNVNLAEVDGIIIDGGGNISQDPLFEDPEILTLSEGSPCINAGAEEFTCNHGMKIMAPEYDILDSIRPNDLYFDMGAYENYLGVFIDDKPVNKESCITICPNPFKVKTQISYELSKKSFVEISIYNTGGSKIQNLLSENQEAGKHTLEFNAASLPAGIFYYRLQAGSQSATGKLIVLK